MEIKYPTEQHAKSAKKIAEYFSEVKSISAVLLTNSCARNKATKDSGLDIVILMQPSNVREIKAIELSWNNYRDRETIFHDLSASGKYSDIDLAFTTGEFKPENYTHDWTSGPDMFEVQIGNFINYSAPLFEKDDYYRNLRRKWLPYYPDDLRKERLAMVLSYAWNNLDHIPLFIDRGLYFQAFDRLYNAYKEFLQALFISKRRYPIAYDKWIKEQIRDILVLPDLYDHLVRLISIENIESTQILDKEQLLRQLIDEYI
jgi:hypothetical protein